MRSFPDQIIAVSDVISAIRGTRCIYHGSDALLEKLALNKCTESLLFVYSVPATTRRTISFFLELLLGSCEQYLAQDRPIEAQTVLRGIVCLSGVYGSTDEVVRQIFELADKSPECYQELATLADRATVAEWVRYLNYHSSHTIAQLAICRASIARRSLLE